MAGPALPYSAVLISFVPNYRRNYQPGGTFFFTVVTAGRAAFFSDPVARTLLRTCIRDERRCRPFKIEAVVLLADHLHTIWTMPHGDSDFSTRWSAIKGNFTRSWLRLGPGERTVSGDQRRQGRRGVFQPRFMEHTIRDEEDFIRHVEYIHYNPVKHGLVRCPVDWRWSSFHRYVKLGVYPENWCCQAAKAELDFSSVRMEILE